MPFCVKRDKKKIKKKKTNCGFDTDSEISDSTDSDLSDDEISQKLPKSSQPTKLLKRD